MRIYTYINARSNECKLRHVKWMQVTTILQFYQKMSFCVVNFMISPFQFEIDFLLNSLPNVRLDQDLSRLFNPGRRQVEREIGRELVKSDRGRSFQGFMSDRHVRQADGKIQGYLAHRKWPPPRTLQQDYVQGHMVARRSGGVSYKWGTPIAHLWRIPSGQTHILGEVCTARSQSGIRSSFQLPWCIPQVVGFQRAAIQIKDL